MVHLRGPIRDHEVGGVHSIDEGRDKVDGTPAPVGHLFLCPVCVCIKIRCELVWGCLLVDSPVIGENSIGQNHPSLLVPMQVVGPLVQPAPELLRAHFSIRHVARSVAHSGESPAGSSLLYPSESPGLSMYL